MNGEEDSIKVAYIGMIAFPVVFGLLSYLAKYALV